MHMVVSKSPRVIMLSPACPASQDAHTCSASKIRGRKRPLRSPGNMALVRGPEEDGMRERWSHLIMAAMVALPSAAQTRDQAKAFVKQAVDFAKKNPREKFLEEVSGPKGQFHFRKGENNDLYIFVYDLEGKVIAHGVRRELVGLNRWNSKDPDGKPWIQDWTRLVKEKGSGWIEYKELNPAQGNKVMKKASWVELHDGMVIGAELHPGGLLHD